MHRRVCFCDILKYAYKVAFAQHLWTKTKLSGIGIFTDKIISSKFSKTSPNKL